MNRKEKRERRKEKRGSLRRLLPSLFGCVASQMSLVNRLRFLRTLVEEDCE